MKENNIGYSIKRVEDHERVGWKAPLFNILGSNVAISELMVGGALVAGMTFKQLLATSIIGNLMLVFILILQGNIGMREGLDTYSLAESTFGLKGGKWIISLILAITSFGWFGVQAGVAGLSLLRIFPNLNLTISVIVLGLLMMCFAVLGFSAMAKFNYLAVPPLIIMMIWGMFKALSINGFESILSYTPASQMTIVEGLNIVIGVVIVGTIISPDQLRYTRSLKDIVIISIIGFALISLFQQVSAGVLAMDSPSWDITEVLENLGFNWVAFLILLLAAWSTNVSNAYSGGLALNTVFPTMKRETLTIIAGLIGTAIAASGIIFKFQEFLGLLSMTISGIAGVMWVDYYILNKKSLKFKEGTNVVAILSWIVAFVVSFLTDRYGIFIPPINAIIVGGLLYYLLMSIKERRKND
ncbi:cytosine permease [uncultured Peptoniphilus sp.]|uniref:cytosine permease n=1 Tax=uncultured Peptoniphilus sp. TaxID=254354 RepID=UPI002804F5DF|nr:cytosine permease [uncultured Peptoniphilus sp.]